MAFPSCVKEHFQPHFSFGFHPEYFLSRFLILFTHFGTPVIQTSWVTGEISPAGNSTLPYHSM